MDNITRALVEEIIGKYGLPYYEHFEQKVHDGIIKPLGLDLRNPRTTGTLELLEKKEDSEYAYFQVLVNSLIPEGPAEEIMKGAIKWYTGEDHYGHYYYDHSVVDKKRLLEKMSPVWVYENRVFLEDFMRPDWEPYEKIKELINSINSL